MNCEHVDVLVIGAGLSGIGAACHLRRECPDRTVAVLEARESLGGTWDLFRYPGIRSDSDMHTMGYRFRPWEGTTALADGPSIRAYLADTAREYDVDRLIRYRHRAVRAEWCSDAARWSVEALRTDTGETVPFTCSFLLSCTGYYDYDAGYTPDFDGVETFRGQVVHPQHWADDLDYAGKRVVVIGSGATAVTLVPVLAERAASVVMLQRSPSYVLSLPARDPLAEGLRRLPHRVAYPVIRWKNLLIAMLNYQLSRRRPALMRRLLRAAARKRLPPGFDVDTHFAPRYAPWDQRMCFVPDGDLFRALCRGVATVVTDRIVRFDEHGIELASGRRLDADLVVTATGLRLLPIGGMRLVVDGREIDLADTVAYKGMMLSGVPNFALAIGYTNASWTLKCDLVSEYVCRLLKHLRRTGQDTVVPVEPGDGPLQPLIDLKSGYVLRSLDALPRQGPRAPWRLYQNYPRDLLLMRYGRLRDAGVRFCTSRAPSSAP